jgi:hypothetical protein
MLVVSESYQNYQNGTVIIQLTDIGSGGVFWIYVNLSSQKAPTPPPPRFTVQLSDVQVNDDIHVPLHLGYLLRGLFSKCACYLEEKAEWSAQYFKTSQKFFLYFFPSKCSRFLFLYIWI